jgi:quercetin dioxygenase-like cupin family protein/SAM-dependent methyltransferase
MLADASLRGADVVELAPGLGRTAVQILRSAPGSYLGIERDPDAARIVAGLVAGRGTCRTRDATATGLLDASADVVVGEAMLSMQTDRGKRAIVTEAARLLRPGGRYAIHELALRPNGLDPALATQIRQDVARSIKVNTRPLTPRAVGCAARGGRAHRGPGAHRAHGAAARAPQPGRRGRPRRAAGRRQRAAGAGRAPPRARHVAHIPPAPPQPWRGLPDCAPPDDWRSPMTENLTSEQVEPEVAAAPMLSHVADVAGLVEIQDDATVSRTILAAEGMRTVLFAFDAGQVLSEHTAAVPAMLQVLSGHLRITAAGRTVDLRPGGLVHFGTRLPHAVEAVEPSRLLLTMLDPRVKG